MLVAGWHAVYFTDVDYDATNAYQIRRLTYPGGKLETVIERWLLAEPFQRR